MNDFIKVNYKSYTTLYSAMRALKELPHTLALDLETQSLYSNSERAEAKLLLKENREELDRPTERFCKLVSNSSGLSFPSITRITHVNIAWSKEDALVIVISTPQMEKAILEWIVDSEHNWLVHNTGFDLKQVYTKTGRFPKKYEDTQLLAKCLINHTETYKAKVGLKELMSSHYDPRWLLTENYDDENLKNESFLRYCAIDSCSTYHLWEMLQEHTKE